MKYLDSSIGPPAAVPATGSVQYIQQSGLYTLSPDQVLRVLSCSGSAYPDANTGDGFLTVPSASIVLELFGDRGATDFVADVTLAVGASGVPLRSGGTGYGFSIRSDYRAEAGLVAIDSNFTLTGNNVEPTAKTVQSFIFRFIVEFANSDAGAHNAGATLVALLQIDQYPPAQAS